MLTFKEKLTNMLISNGMFESQAKEVIALAEPKLKEVVENYNINLNDTCNNYPPIITSLLFGYIKPIALIWIDENKPMAWFRPRFV